MLCAPGTAARLACPSAVKPHSAVDKQWIDSATCTSSRLACHCAPTSNARPQTMVLARRYARFWVRTPGMLTTEVIQYAFYGVFFGAVFYRSAWTR